MKVLITGGAGFIGRNLVQCLASDHCEVFVVDDSSRYGTTSLSELASCPNVITLKGDLTNPSVLTRVPPVDRVYHLAGMVGVGRVVENPRLVMRVNTLSTLHVCDWFLDKCSPDARLLYSSTSEVYAGGHFAGLDLPIPTPEEVPFVLADAANPRFSYAISKMWGEMYCRFAAAGSGRVIRSVRYHNVYGPRMGFEHVIPQVIRRIIKREDPFRIWGKSETRAFCWIDDAAEATIRVIEAPENADGTVVHIGTEEEVAVSELYEKLFRLCGWRPSVMIDAGASAGSVPRRCPDISRLRRLTGYIPSTPLDKGLAATARWYLENCK